MVDVVDRGERGPRRPPGPARPRGQGITSLSQSIEPEAPAQAVEVARHEVEGLARRLGLTAEVGDIPQERGPVDQGVAPAVDHEEAQRAGSLAKIHLDSHRRAVPNRRATNEADRPGRADSELEPVGCPRSVLNLDPRPGRPEVGDHLIEPVVGRSLAQDDDVGALGGDRPADRRPTLGVALASSAPDDIPVEHVDLPPHLWGLRLSGGAPPTNQRERRLHNRRQPDRREGEPRLRNRQTSTPAEQVNTDRRAAQQRQRQVHGQRPGHRPIADHLAEHAQGDQAEQARHCQPPYPVAPPRRDGPPTWSLRVIRQNVVSPGPGRLVHRSSPRRQDVMREMPGRDRHWASRSTRQLTIRRLGEDATDHSDWVAASGAVALAWRVRIRACSSSPGRRP